MTRNRTDANVLKSDKGRNASDLLIWNTTTLVGFPSLNSGQYLSSVAGCRGTDVTQAGNILFRLQKDQRHKSGKSASDLLVSTLGA